MCQKISFRLPRGIALYCLFPTECRHLNTRAGLTTKPSNMFFTAVHHKIDKLAKTIKKNINLQLFQPYYYNSCVIWS